MPVNAWCQIGAVFNDNNGIYYEVTSETEVSVTYPDDYDPWGWTDNEYGYPSYNGDITIPANVIYEGKIYEVTSIGMAAFEACADLLSVKLPNTIRSFEANAFYKCTSLTSINIPSSIVSIGDRALQACACASIDLPEGLESLGYCAFYGCSFEYITVPSTVTFFDDAVFANCSNLIEVDFLSAISEFPTELFQNCSNLKKVSIPSTVTSIEKDAFVGCGNIQKVLLNNKTSVVDIKPNAFPASVFSNATLYVPAGKLSDYLGCGFANISDDAVVEVSVWPSPFGVGSVTGADIYQGGDEFTVVATPTSKYVFAGWEYPEDMDVIEENENSIKFSLSAEVASKYMASGIDIIAKFEKVKYTLSLVYDENDGVVTGATDGQLFEVDSKVTLTAVPNPGYHFLKFTDENDAVLASTAISSVATTDVVFTDNKTVKAIFEENPSYNVSLTVNGNAFGHVTGLRNEGIYLQGQEIALTAIPENHCKFAGWTVDGTNAGNDEELTIGDVDKDYAIVATFTEDPKSTLTIGVKDNIPGCSVGFVNSSFSSPQTLYVGETAAIIANAAPTHYHFVEWINAANGVQVSDQMTFVVEYGNDDLNYLAVYEEDPTYSIIVESDMPEASDLVETTYSGLYDADVQNLGFTVNTGYEFVSWEYGVTGGSTTSTSLDPSQNVVVNGNNMTYVAHFQKKSFNIVSEAENGSILLSANSAVMGAEITVDATPAEGYELVSVTTDQVGTDIVNGKFIMPASDVVVSATFKKHDYAITSGIIANGTISVASSAQMGEEVVVTPTPAAGYEFEAISTTPATIISGNKFTMPASDVTVNAAFKAIVYNVTAATPVNGKVDLSASSATIGTEVIVTATPDAGYVLESLTTNVEGVDVVDGKFSMPASDIEVSAVFKKVDYLIITGTTVNGSISVVEGAQIGEVITVTVTPDEGYELEGLTTSVEGLTVVDGQFTMPASDVTVYATFKLKEFNVIAAIAENGKIMTSVSKAVMNTPVTVATIAAEGYELDTIMTNIEGLKVADGGFTMPASDVTVSAIFKKVNYAITTSDIANGTVTVAESAQMGDVVEVIANPSLGYELEAISTIPELEVVDGKFVMPAGSVVVNATFKAIEYDITTATTTNGTLALSAEKATIGTVVSVIASPAVGYEVESITTNIEGLEVVDGKFIMPASDVVVNATFKAIVYKVNVAESENGSVTTSVQTATIGNEVVVAIDAAEGYELDKLMTNVDGLAIADNKFVMPASDVTVTATFKAVVYTVATVEVSNGSVALSAEKATIGTSVSVTATPDEGYELESVTTSIEGLNVVDGKFTMPASNVEVSASFKAIVYDVNVATANNGKVKVSSSTAIIGDELTVTVDPAEGYELESLTTDIEGLEIVDGKFIMPANNVTVSATFKVACETCKNKVEIASIFDWILVVDNNSLKEVYEGVSSEDVAWYRVVDDADEWCEGAQNEMGKPDEKVATGFYFADDNQSLLNTGDYYVVITLKNHMCKYITSDVVSYSSSNKMLLTPTSVRHGQTLTLTGLPSVNAVVNVYDVRGTLVKTMNTEGNSIMTFEAESVNGIYVVSVIADQYVKSIKYIVK